MAAGEVKGGREVEKERERKRQQERERNLVIQRSHVFGGDPGQSGHPQGLCSKDIQE